MYVLWFSVHLGPLFGRLRGDDLYAHAGVDLPLVRVQPELSGFKLRFTFI